MPKISFSSLYDHFTYQTNGNETYNNIQANMLSLYTPLTIAGWVYRVIFLFTESSHVAYQINGNEA